MKEIDEATKKFYNTPFAPVSILTNKEGTKEFLNLNFFKGDLNEKVRVMIPLSNFNYETNLEIKNLENLSLTKIPTDFIGFNEWQERCRNLLNWFDYAFHEEIVCPKAKLSEIESGMGIGHFDESIFWIHETEKFEILLLSLRLFKPDDIWYDSAIKLFDVKNKLYNLAIFAQRYTGGSTNPTHGYKLTDNDMDSFLKFRDFVGENHHLFSNNKRLKVALSFFESSYSCVPCHQKFVNLIIALESLLTGDERQEITHRICSRMALLIANKKRLSIYNEGKRLFKIRGKIVHGSFSGEHLAPAKDETYMGTYILRQLVSFCIINFMKLLQNGEKEESIIKILDEASFDENINQKLKNYTERFPFVTLRS